MSKWYRVEIRKTAIVTVEVKDDENEDVAMDWACAEGDDAHASWEVDSCGLIEADSLATERNCGDLDLPMLDEDGEDDEDEGDSEGDQS